MIGDQTKGLPKEGMKLVGYLKSLCFVGCLRCSRVCIQEMALRESTALGLRRIITHTRDNWNFESFPIAHLNPQNGCLLVLKGLESKHLSLHLPMQSFSTFPNKPIS